MAYSTSTEVLYKCKLTTDEVSSASITQFITWADNYIELKTGKKWTSATSYTEYFDLVENEYHKDVLLEGGHMAYEPPYLDKFTIVVTKNKPITKVSSISFIQHDYELDFLYSYDSDAGTYTDNTSEANSVRGTPFYAFASSVGTGDCLYIACSYVFSGITINLSTAGSGGVLVWEYYNGSAWTTLSVSESVSGADDLNASGNVTWTIPSDWQETSVNSSANYYWIRARVTTAHSTSPKINNLSYEQNAVVSEELETYDYQWDTNGRVIIKGNYPTSEFNYLQVIYSAGASSTPTAVQELSANLAAQKCLIAMMGGSFDDLTSGRIGDEQWTTGEPYMNLKATLIELRNEEIGLWNQLGVRVKIIGS